MNDIELTIPLGFIKIFLLLVKKKVKYFLWPEKYWQK